MKLYLVIAVTLFFSLRLKAGEYLPGPFYWEENYSVRDNHFKNLMSRTCWAPNHISPEQSELFESVSLYQPFNKIHGQGFMNGTEIFNVDYDVVEYGFRQTPKNLVSPKNKKHLIIAGDSNTFGYGVQVEYTLPVLLAKKLKGLHPYNFSVPGRGPNNTLALMEFFPWEKIVYRPEGYFIYNYYDFLMERTIGEKAFVATAAGQSPWYELNSEDQVEYKGNFNDRFLTKIYKWIYSKPWLNNLLPVLPRYSNKHSVFMAKIFLKMKEEYLKKFPEGRYIVALNYFSNFKAYRLDDLAEELAKNKIEYIEINKGVPFVPEHIYPDTHLNTAGHIKEAELFLEVLSLNKIIR